MAKRKVWAPKADNWRPIAAQRELEGRLIVLKLVSVFEALTLLFPNEIKIKSDISQCIFYSSPLFTYPYGRVV